MDRLKQVLQAAFALLIPISLNIHFKTNLTLEIVIIFLIILSFKLLPKKNMIKTIFVICLITTFYILIIINPFSFYSVWLQQLKTDLPHGRITNLILIIYFTSFIYLVININKNNMLKNFLFLLIISLFILPLLFNKYILISYTPILLILLISLNNRNINLKINITISIFLFIVYIFSFNNSGLLTSSGSSFVNSNSYSLRSFLVDKFPQIDILTSIPGEDGLSKSIGRSPILTNSRLFKISGEPNKKYYIRLKVENHNNEVEIINKLKDVNKLKSIKLTILSDYLSLIPNILGSKYLKTTKIETPLSKNSEIFLEINKNYSSIKPDDNYLIPAINNLEIDKLAISLKGKNDNQTLYNIRDYLISNYKYSTETYNDYNYIENFLFQNKSGFCVHFTRSFIELARRNGFHTREVSGYMIKIPRERQNDSSLKYGEVYITGKNTHLWPEVYYNNKWITFDVTPGLFEAEVTSTNINYMTISNDKVIIAGEDIPDKKYLYPYILFLLFIPILSIILFLKQDPIKKIIKLAEKKGIKRPEYIGWVEWNTILFNSNKYTKLFLEYSYNNKNLSKEDRLLLKKLNKLARYNFHNSA